MLRSYGGLGLGRAIARQLVKLHDETLQAQSKKEGQGSTFTIELSLISTGLENIENLIAWTSQEINSNYLPLENLPTRQGLQVLVVDDEDDNRAIITLALLEYKVKVITANCAMAAKLVKD